MKEGFIKRYLKEIKEEVAINGCRPENRGKNVNFMRDHFLNHSDLKEIVMDLSPGDCVGGPEPDHGNYEGQVIKFKSTYLNNLIIYIKVRYNLPDEVVFISFHEDE